jgi:hypothetical protein
MTDQVPKKPKLTSVIVSREMLDDLTLIRLAFGKTARAHLDELAGEAIRSRANEARRVLAKRFSKKGG